MTFHVIPPDSRTVLRLHEAEETLLGPWGMRTAQSRGRRHIEPHHPYRTAYQRDRDRIIHSAAFRRLAHKTQVFVGQPNDHQRTRLTHTLEVCQIARTVARALRLNEDLTEAIALAHDLGHPPFGHAGERALARLMENHRGFEHNRQGLRIVDRLEQRYPTFDGLNLSFEVLESLALRCHDRSHPAVMEFEPERRMLAEAQVVDAADSIAYGTHDIDDALRAGLIGFDDLRGLELWRRAEDRVRQLSPSGLAGKQLSRAIIRSLIDAQVSSLLAESQARLDRLDRLDRIGDRTGAQRIQQCEGDVIALDPDTACWHAELADFLHEHVYRHDDVLRTTRVAERMVQQLFEELVRAPSLLPRKYGDRLAIEPVEPVVGDYVAGMTDRLAQTEHRRLFEP